MSTNITAHMPGTIVEILVKVGDHVQVDDEMIILEAMKMENPIYAPTAGVVTEIKVKEKEKVAANQILLILE